MEVEEGSTSNNNNNNNNLLLSTNGHLILEQQSQIPPSNSSSTTTPSNTTLVDLITPLLLSNGTTTTNLKPLLTIPSNIEAITTPGLEEGVKVEEQLIEEEEPEVIINYEKELPVIMNDLIPLNFIIERLVGQAYAELVNLTETLPSTPDIEKKRVIVDYVLQTRRQILKLLVLVRWSSEAAQVGKCMNIVGFLSRQNYQFDHAIETLTEIKSMLAGARLRNYDIPTALSVLTTGTYTGLPTIITETLGGPEEKLNDDKVEETISELEEVLRWRLNCVEKLPKAMRAFWIGKGRATFRVDKMWEAEFTYGGDNDDLEANWYLLNLNFLFRVKDTRGVWSSTPGGPMKDHIIELCNSELARRIPPPSVPPIGEIEAGQDVLTDSGNSKPYQDVPLIRGYNFIQRLTLCYQLEALHTQALLLAATVWSGNLRVEFSTDRKSLRIEYWAPPPIPQIKPRTTTSSNLVSGPSVAPAPQGILIISMDESWEGGNSDVKSGNRNEREEGGEEETLREVSGGLKIVWIAESLEEEKQSEVDLSLNSDLDLEELLVRTTSTHAREATLQLYDLLLLDLDSSDLELVSSDIPSTSLPISTSLSSTSTSTSNSSSLPTNISGIQIHLHGQHYVIASINSLSGRLEFKAVGEVSASREIRLRNAADKVDKDRKLTGETLLRVRASTILDEVDSRAAYLGLTTLRRLPLRPQDTAKFGNATRQFLFIKLHSQLPLHYLVLVMNEEGFKFALISTREESDGNMQTWLSLEELGWLDRNLSRGSSTTASGGGSNWLAINGEESKKRELYGFDLSIEDLRDLHSYCVQRIAFFKIEQQLHIRRIPYRPVAAYVTPLAEDSNNITLAENGKSRLLTDQTPYLVIQSADLIRSNVKIAHSNIAIQCYLRDNVIKTTLHVRFRDLSLVDFPNPEDLPSSMTCDPKTWTVTFTSDNLEEVVPTFLTAYSIITRAVLLARHNRSVLRQEEIAKNKIDL